MNKWVRPVGSNSALAEPTHAGVAQPSKQYFAFLSYSHKDAADADWLHGELERFRVPSKLAGKLTSSGVIPTCLTPIFRDRHELAASRDLGVEIREALETSHCLVVLCSPAAAASKWTNAEIELFKRLHPDGCVIAAIVGGEPFASEMKGREQEECLPPALRLQYDRRGRSTGRRLEPLAADLREAGEGRRLGFLKIVAGVLGVGLDDLVRRDQLRRHRRLAGIAAASITGMVIALVLAISAIDARDDARDERRKAESLIGFMLGDLKDKLEPLGRLDVLDSVGAQAMAYYASQDTSELSDEALAKRSSALMLMGQVASTRGDLDRAHQLYRGAFDGTAEALRRSPEDAERIFDHAQNVFYLGDLARLRDDSPKAEAAMREYKRLAEQMIAKDPSNPKWQMEGIYADTNLGILLHETGRYSEAAAVFENAIAVRERLATTYPANEEYRRSLIEVLAWLSEAREKEGRLEDGLAHRERQIALLQPLIQGRNGDADYKRQALVAYRVAGRLNVIRGNSAKGLEQLRTAAAIGEQLIRIEPENAQSVQLTVGVQFDLARIEVTRGNFDQASDLIRSACDRTNQLIAKDASVALWRLGLRSDCLEVRARVALARGMPAEAVDRAAEMLRTARAENAKSRSEDAQLALANAHLIYALAAQAHGDRPAAVAEFRNAARAWPGSVPDRPSLIAKKVIILRGLNRRPHADELARRLAEIGYGDPTYLRDLRSFR
jgi:tetratricopeptide (TPR) repeat protein